jgi:hypothetical protein
VDSAPRIAVLVLNTQWANEVGDTNHPVQATRNGFSIIDVTSWETVKTRTEAALTGGFKGAFLLGYDYQFVSLRWFFEQIPISWDIEPFISRFGQVAATFLDRTSTASGVPHDTDEHDILEGSFSINAKPFAVENVTQYVYRRNYVKALQQLDDPEGTRLPREPFDEEWLSGVQTITNSTSVTALGGTPRGRRKSQVQKMELTRHQGTADAVAQRRNDLRSPANGRAEATYAIQLQKADTAELGDLRKVTHPEGLGTNGWEEQRVQIRAIEEDWNIDEMCAYLTVRDVDDLLA